MPKNWNSKKDSWSDIESDEILKKADLAKKLKSDGRSVAEIAEKLNLSKGRIYEYLRD